ncbi:hypothetical protein BKA64DRAFT_647882 [Cadophora sp. MPI-SDFR-AT-0126]|nr:hypothetical protein BKA64DRAFT_647882 [Leotiomycetes sp. MPI-SDFR-AT-0126]
MNGGIPRVALEKRSTQGIKDIFRFWNCLSGICIFCSFGIFYVLGAGLRNQIVIPAAAIRPLGIDKVSSYYGPGSWASWLLTTAACCIDRIFRKPDIEQPKGSIHKFFSGIDLNIIGVFSYPMIAGIDLLLMSNHDFDNSPVQYGRPIASVAVLHLGIGVGILLTVICVRRWVQYEIGLAAVIFSAFATWTLCTMLNVSVRQLLGVPLKDILLPFFVLPRTGQLSEREVAYFRLLQLSGLYPTAFDGAYISMLIFAIREVTDLGWVLYPILGLSGLLLLLSSSRQSDRTPFITQGVTTAVHTVLISSATISLILICLFSMHIWLSASPPPTTTSMLDLDQLSSLCLGGVLIYVGSGIRLLDDGSWVWQQLWGIIHQILACLAGLYHRLHSIYRRQATQAEDGIPLPSISPASQG